MTQPPHQTGNSLRDIIDWIKQGDFIILHHQGLYARYYHQCSEKSAKYRIIYINIINYPDLLNDGEWPWYIEDEGCTLCNCEIKTKIKELDTGADIYRFQF